MRIVWRGHAFFEVETAGGLSVLIDPFVENGRTRARVRDFDPDVILLTHAHDDHVGSALEFGVPIVSNWEIVTHLSSKGARNVVAMNVGGFHRQEGLKVWMAPAAHSSGFASPNGGVSYGGSPCGFVLDDGETRFYHAGDTGLFGDMRTVIRDVLRPDVAAVPIGDLFTMGPEHAAIAVDWLGAKVALPMHYGTFPPIRQDPQEWVRRVGDRATALVPAVDEGVDVVGGRVQGAARGAAAGAR